MGSQPTRRTLAIIGALVLGAGIACAAESKERKEYPDYQEVIKDHEKITGFLTLWYDKEKDSLLLEIPKGKLAQEFLLATSIAGGGRFTGFQWGERLLHWEARGKKLLLVEPELRHPRGKESPSARLIERTYPDGILRAVPIATRSSRGDYVVDLGAVLKSDLAGLGSVLGGKLDKDLSRWLPIKNFPSNTELSLDAIAMKGASGSRGVVHFSLSELPSTGYAPRDADDRVGYFLTVLRDWRSKLSERTTFRRYINRWHLEKRDKEARLSEPVEPIIFYIEETVPVPLRRYVKEGILAWNEAFERCGFLDAIIVRGQWESDEFASLDPEDVRYNFFRWIVSGGGFAMGPSRVHPRTGQILDADIIFDDAFLRYFVEEYERSNPATGEVLTQHDPVLEHFLEQHLPPTVEEPFLTGNAQAPCQYARGLVHELNVARAAMAAEGKRELPMEFLGQMLKEVVMHEVGHTLGLRHNFRASAWKTMEEINKVTDADEPTVASVMDYNGANFVPEGLEQGVYITRALGPYDLWAIEYGYRVPTKEEKDESKMLAAIASRSGEPALAYATDEDTSLLGPDPLVNRFDLGQDLVAYARQRVALVRKLLADVETWAVDEGDSYSRLRHMFNALLGEYGQACRFAARYVGGQYISRSHRGDEGADAPITVVPAAQQREAVDFLCESMFAPGAWEFSPDLLQLMAAGRYSHWSSDDYDSNLDYDLHDRIRSMQAGTLFVLLNPVALSRLHGSPVLVAKGEDRYTVPEHLDRLMTSIWSELQEAPPEGQPYIDSFRRGLQRQMVAYLQPLVLDPAGKNVPADVNAIARSQLAGLEGRIAQTLTQWGEQMDPYSRAHLEDTRERVQRLLTASYQLR
jgi:hypothetical protein